MIFATNLQLLVGLEYNEDMYFNLLAINLFNPSHVSGWFYIVILSILLGIVHGITPDEHTWPITFSYAIGSYSSKKGFKNGLIFSLAFTIQRAIASELAYIGLARFFNFSNVNYIIYIVVGILMAVAGLMISRKSTIFHFDIPFFKSHKTKDKEPMEWLNDPKPWMPAVHGFVAGWGFGAFAIILYTVITPAVHSVALAWVPGALFGLGTMLIQIIAGSLFGFIASRRGINQDSIRRIALKTAANTLTYGGLAFVLGGALGLIFPSIANFSFNTGIKVHNLDSIGLSFFLVIFSVVIVGFVTLIRQTRLEKKLT